MEFSLIEKDFIFGIDIIIGNTIKIEKFKSNTKD
jgi:hypothetical protein